MGESKFISVSFKPNKKLGQHFLKDSRVVEKIIASAALKETDVVLEIGSGPGILTKALLETGAKKIIIIEFDSQFWPSLEALEKSSQNRLQLIKGDALKISLSSLGEPTFKIISNLPYNIGTQLLLNWLQELPFISTMILMFQKEVVERICAEPRTKDYGRLSILAQWKCKTTNLFTVPASAFSPPPKVDSAVIEIIPRPHPLFEVTERKLERLTHTLFQHRRKMIRTALKSLEIPDLEKKLESLGIQETMRAEELSVEDFCRLANFMKPKGGH